MIPHAERLELLKRVSLFAHLDGAALEALAGQVGEREFEPGQTVFYEGTLGEVCYVIVSGMVQVVKQVDTIKEIVLAERGPVSVVGEMALLGGQRRSATVRAMGRTTALELSKQGLDEVMATHPQIAADVIKTLLGYVHSMTAQVATIEGQVLGGGDFIQVEVGQRLGQFRLDEVVGKGGMATVYSAYDTENDRQVALKVLSPQLSQQEGFLDRFRREAVVFAGLSHEHILPVYSFGERGGVTYIATRLVTGGTLADRMTEPMSFLWATHYLEELAAALDYAHGRGLIHRDVKPRNVLVDAGEWCYLADFGIAALAAAAADGSSAPTVERLPVGTPAYLAPERVRGETPTRSSDIYSLAVMLYEMITGRLPFQGDTAWKTAAAHANDPVPSARRHNPDLPRAADLVLRRALAKQPEERFASAGELAVAWREALSLSAADLDKMRADLEGRPAASAAALPAGRQTAAVDVPEPDTESLGDTEAVPPPVPPVSPAVMDTPGAPATDRRVQVVLYAALGVLVVAAIVSFILAFAVR